METPLILPVVRPGECGSRWLSSFPKCRIRARHLRKTLLPIHNFLLRTIKSLSVRVRLETSLGGKAECENSIPGYPASKARSRPLFHNCASIIHNRQKDLSLALDSRAFGGDFCGVPREPTLLLRAQRPRARSPQRMGHPLSCET